MGHFAPQKAQWSPHPTGEAQLRPMLHALAPPGGVDIQGISLLGMPKVFLFVSLFGVPEDSLCSPLWNLWGFPFGPFFILFVSRFCLPLFVRFCFPFWNL